MTVVMPMGSRQEESAAPPWYDTYGGITKAMSSIGGFNNLLEARHQAGYGRKERLQNWVVMGHWKLDSVGNALKRSRDRGEDFDLLEVPDLLREEDFQTLDTPEFLSWSFFVEIPPAHIICPHCRKGWDSLRDCREIIRIYDQFHLMSLKEFEGETFEMARAAIERRDDGVYRFLSYDEDDYDRIPIRSDQFIDLEEQPHPKYEGTTFVNNRGWALQKHELDEGYVIQPNDDVQVARGEYYHRGCYAEHLHLKAEGVVREIFVAAGLKEDEFVMEPIPNGYCPCDHCPPWFKVSSANLGGAQEYRFTFGRRKRVYAIEWDEMGEVPASLFKGEGVTNDETGIHAWTDEKASEYIHKILDHFGG